MSVIVPIPPAYKDGTPLIDHLYSPLSSTLHACQTVDSTQSTLSDRLLQLWNLEASSNSALQVLIKNTQEVANSSLLAPSDDPSTYYFVGDTFDGTGSLDSSTTCYLDQESGTILLPVTATQNLTQYVTQIDILSKSVGRPGDYTAIRNLSFDSSNSPQVSMALDPNIDIASIIDGKPDTWYCWENVLVPRTQKCRRVGPNNAILADSNSGTNDVQSIIGGHGITTQVSIPGQGDVTAPLFTFVQDSSVTASTTTNIPTEISPGAGVLSVPGQTPAVLSIQFAFSDPVPLSSIRISPHIEQGQSVPTVTEIIAILADGTSSRPVGLPRPITAISGLQVSTERAINAASTQPNYTGSGVFFVNPGNVGVVSLIVTLTCEPSVALFGIAHSFYIENTQTKESTSILGIRVKNSTSHGQNRIDGPSISSQQNIYSSSVGTMSGPLGNIVSTARIFSVDQANNLAKNSLVNALSSSSFYNPQINIRNKRLQNAANIAVNTVAQSTGVGNVVSALSQSATAAKTILQATGVGGSVGAALAGPVGIVVGAALTGNLFNHKKTTSVVSTGNGIDVLAGERASINIQDITFDSRNFAEQGSVNSTTLTFSNYVRAVQLFVQASIPGEWPVGPWVTAKVQAIYDQGQSEWVSILPQGASWSGDSSKETITFDQPFTRVKVQFSMQRPSGTTYQTQTPILNSYVIKGLPA